MPALTTTAPGDESSGALLITKPHTSSTSTRRKDNLIASIDTIFSQEIDALLNALRRDLHAEQSNALAKPEMAELHSMNARATLRLLEVLNPRSQKRAEQQSMFV